MAASSPSRSVKLFGTESKDAKGRLLSAGVLSAVLDAGAVRYVRLGETEVIRAIAFLVRDENWGTFTPEITGLKIAEGSGAFEVTYEGRCADARRSLRYSATIRGTADGGLSFKVDARPDTDILTNRTGFVVLHPIEGIAGAPVEVEHTDGRKTHDQFPWLIEPSQPFLDIGALTHEPVPGLRVTCRMEGGAFEMEDQRNWTDASFKTYIRPLSLPWPYTLPAGDTFGQSVTVTCEGKLPRAPVNSDLPAVTISVHAPTGQQMPRIGIGLPSEEAAAAIALADLVKSAGIDLLVCRLDCRRGDLETTADALGKLVSATGADSVLEILLPDQGEPAVSLTKVKRIADANGLKPVAITVSPAAHLKSYQPDGKWPEVPSFAAMYAAARVVFPEVPLGGGTYAYFTELNRCRPPAELLDFVSHTTLPIVHAADDVSVMETLQAMPHVIRSTRAFIKGKAYRIGPSAISARDNPYGTGTAANPGNGRVCLAAMDPRQRGLFGAAWTLAYLAELAKGGIEVASMGATSGPSGIIASKTSYSQPYFDDLPGPAVYPLYHVISGFAHASGSNVLETLSTHGSLVAAIAWQTDRCTEIWMANLTESEQRVSLVGIGGVPLRAAILDEDNFDEAATRPGLLDETRFELQASGALTLKAYSVARFWAART